MLVEPVAEGTPIHRLAARSVFWEMKTTVADPDFEKEAWLSATLLSFGPCGFTVGDEATVLYCSPDLAQGAAKLPTAPVGSDAAIVTSLFISPARASRGLEAVLLDAAIMDLTSRDFPAVEAFGYRDRDEAARLLGSKPAFIGLLPVETLESAGFMVIQDHPVTPRLRLDLPPAFDLLTAAAVEDMVARALA
ncbi:hypothetical protein [uncultured Corynebacterium sp.]|uniref:hypothetical protein n=1 Tax=uncultured Corynebacterium sp. TaxID=159447 RepID=UPI0025D37643|nr:hypothetical protein [uncultured Corynebacterium sp.]